MSERITDKKKYRRTRRNRLRHCKPRFDNRKRPGGWLAPSIQHKLDSHIKLVEEQKLYYTAAAAEDAGREWIMRGS